MFISFCQDSTFSRIFRNMNGFIVFDTRSGSSIVSQILQPRFAIPGLSCTEEDLARDVAAFVFSIQLNAAEAVRKSGNEERKPGSPNNGVDSTSNAAALTFHQVSRESELFFFAHQEFPVGVVVSMMANSSQGPHLAENMCKGFCRTVGLDYVADILAGMQRSYRKAFIPLVRQLLRQAVVEIMACWIQYTSTDWLCCFFSPQLQVLLTKSGSSQEDLADAIEATSTRKTRKKDARVPRIGGPCIIDQVIEDAFQLAMFVDQGEEERNMKDSAAIYSDTEEEPTLVGHSSIQQLAPTFLPACVTSLKAACIGHTRNKVFLSCTVPSPFSLLKTTSAHISLSGGFCTITPCAPRPGGKDSLQEMEQLLECMHRIGISFVDA